jgi:hypothetical protein
MGSPPADFVIAAHPGEDEQGQIALAAVVAVVEGELLLAVGRIITGIEVEHDLSRGRPTSCSPTSEDCRRRFLVLASPPFAKSSRVSRVIRRSLDERHLEWNEPFPAGKTRELLSSRYPRAIGR